MNERFIEACDNEILQNENKGQWGNWAPGIKEIVQEIMWHVAKLNKALLTENSFEIKEHSCDLANYCEKAFLTADEMCNEMSALDMLY